ncbi:CBS domain-containing protein [Streptomyces cinnamoneus]|uniref:CBS domain-containing protein n=1 Tax=Streptomyces cinnamoneus TaxID=53446 RepID=A0A2G1XD85_STRCJ|nr:CBS domain-containing protein [Streptomyces cinnamoneus]PHQ49161.1 CBS domain-containing protein [Streptomyces cinnamoneus]PPT15189.1 CBS domain-containing protein [Streptomyces cinnamoneus]
MTKAKDIMHPGAQWITRDETLSRAAQVMEMLDVGALPVSDENSRLCGIVTDRDIVVKCLARGRDPAKVTAGELCEGTPRWIDADADVQEVLNEMERHRIRRLPVVENKRLVGMISEADVVRQLPDDQVAEFTSAIYSSPTST